MCKWFSVTCLVDTVRTCTLKPWKWRVVNVIEVFEFVCEKVKLGLSKELGEVVFLFIAWLQMVFVYLSIGMIRVELIQSVGS